MRPYNCKSWNCRACDFIYRVGKVGYRCERYGSDQDMIYHLTCDKCGTEHLVHYFKGKRQEDCGYVLLAKEGPQHGPQRPQHTPEKIEKERIRKLLEKEQYFRSLELEKRHPFPFLLSISEVCRFVYGCFAVLPTLLRILSWNTVCVPFQWLYVWICKRYWATDLAKRRLQETQPVPEFDEAWIEVIRGQAGSSPEMSQLCCHHCANVGSLSDDIETCPLCGTHGMAISNEDYYDVIFCGGRRVSDISMKVIF